MAASGSGIGVCSVPRICASAAGTPFAQVVSAFMRTGSGAYGRAT